MSIGSRLEHWGLLYVNNQQVSDDEILSANETYGSLGELAIMSFPKQNILNLFKKLELGDVTKEMTTSDDFLATIKDANVKEIIALLTSKNKFQSIFSQLFNNYSSIKRFQLT